MTKLYSELAQVYHEMYQSVFDYKKEFKFYNNVLRKYNCKNVLEIGCGSGNLAGLFLKSGYSYTGLDLFDEMLNIARKAEPKAMFIQGDMRNLKMKKKYDAIIVTGRSFTYMTKNQDVMKALRSMNNVLAKNGILIFDNFNAEVIFGRFKKRFVQKAKYGGKEYRRVSENTWNMETGWTWNWDTKYYIKENGKIKTVFDKSVLRAFTEDELKLFLKISGFKVLKTIKQGTPITIIAGKG